MVATGGSTILPMINNKINIKICSFVYDKEINKYTQLENGCDCILSC